MQALQLFGFALLALFLYSVLKQYSPSYAVLCSTAACAVLLLVALDVVRPVLDMTRRLAAYSEWGDYDVVCKAVAIALLTQWTQELCRESGQQALAGRVEFAGKAAMLVCAMPLFASLVELVMELLQ